MPATFGKEVIVCHAPEDRSVADEFARVLLELFGEQVWVRHFDVAAGQILTDAISRAIEDARWFVILLSQAALRSSWVQAEAHLATFRAIENEDFKIMVLKLDDIVVPNHIKLAIPKENVWDLTANRPREAEFVRLAEHIQDCQSTKATHDVYVGRGDASDRFALIARRNRIIFVLGWPGIGKSAFCTHSIPQVLQRRPLSVSLSRGHSADLLARQLLQRAHAPQPMGRDAYSDQELMAAAVEAVASRGDKFFLFLDEAEEALDPNSKPLPFLEDALVRLGRARQQVHVVIATTRFPDYSAAAGQTADVLRLGTMDDTYIREAIDQWLTGHHEHASLMHSPNMDELIALAGGHPLAAKLIASQLAADKGLDELLSAKQKNRFELKLAEYILRTAEYALSPAQALLLRILAVVAQPVTMGDVLALPVVRQFGADALQEARAQLSDRFLVEQKAELISLHKFLGTFFRDELFKNKQQRHAIAGEFGEYACEKAVELNKDLMRVLGHVDRSDPLAIDLSNEVFRYAIPAANLLRSVGRDELANTLPILVQGTVREMVFHFYQVEHDYRTALRYADQWLSLYPDDLEIKLYQARCYRNERDANSLAKAVKILKQLEERDQQQYMQVRVLRERGWIAELQGDLDAAKQYFRKGISRAQKGAFYIDNHVGLAGLLLRESENNADATKAHEALDLLESARQNSATFDRFHLGMYVEALIKNGQDERAMPLLAEALAESPNDPQLNYSLAEIMRRKGSLKEAERYARAALQCGSTKATLTLANILCTQAANRLDNGAVKEAEELLQRALSALDGFHPVYGTDQEIADSIRAKTLRLLDNWTGARDAVAPYIETTNSFTVYEQCKADLHFSEMEAAASNWSAALTKARQALSRLNRMAMHGKLPEQLEELRLQAEMREKQMLQNIN